MTVAERTLGLDAHPELRLREALDVLADTWQPHTGRFLLDGQLAHRWLRRAVELLAARAPVAFIDCIEVHLRTWLAAHPTLPAALRVAVRRALRDVIAASSCARPT